MIISPLERSILLTLGYTHQFSYPLTSIELYYRLLNVSQVSGSAFVASLKALSASHLIIWDNPYISLGSVSPLIGSREKRSLNSQKKIRELHPLLKFASCIPWIQAVGLTGSVAMKNASEFDDTDIFMVVEPHSLWLIRPCIVLFSLFRKKRRTWNKEEPNSWCFNLWLEGNKLAMPSKKRTMYTAYEVCQVVWMFDRTNVRQRFLLDNSWVRTYLPRYHSRLLAQKNLIKKNWFIKIVLAVFFPITIVLNTLSFVVQWWYMRPHMTRERVTLHTAFFHPRDTHGIISERWKDAIQHTVNT